MSAVTSKIRIYDLAKELKLESKRLIEEIKREGVDVSVPSNTVSKELAEKIRNRYFPKSAPPKERSIRVIKHKVEAPAPAAEAVSADVHVSVSPEAQAATLATEAPVAPPAEDQAASAATPKPSVARLVKKLPPAQRAEPPAATQASPVESAAPATAAEIEFDDAAATASQASAQALTEDAPQLQTNESASQPQARQVRVLRPTQAALDSGIKHGERAPAPVVAVPAAVPTRERGGRGGRGRRDASFEPHGTPGESASPQTVYTPPADARRPGGRSARSRRGGAPIGDSRGRGGRFDRDYVAPGRALSLEDRIKGSMTGGTGTAVDELKSVRLVEGSTVKEFAEKLGIKPKEVVALLLQRKVFATINQALDNEVASELGRRFGYDVQFVPFEEMVAEEEFEELIATDADDVELPRAPVVTVMGHVDHGKTSLLDAIRATEVAAGEAGGITQHIGAYSVQVASADAPNQLRRVVFLDTPGHEAFTMMRARGAKATDIVVLVVAADDGVMPQTIEAIEHARAAHVPIVVAINKIDKPDANPARVRQELAKQGLNPVEWGGETEMVEVSAKQRTNLEALLETILLSADILNLKASPTRLASGVVLEAKLDRGRGAVATVLVQQGTLHVHDPFIAGQVFGKVRAMFDDRGQAVTVVGPSTPVEVLGLQGVPQAGDTLQVVADISRAQNISDHRQTLARQSALLQSTKRGIEALGQKEVKELLVVLKADVQGSVEVLKSTLTKLSTEVVKVKVIRSGVGAITESDVLLASATQAGASNSAVVIIGFNVRPESRANDLAKFEHVDIRLHSIIYKVEEEIRAAMIGMLDKIETERVLGKADVRMVFKVPRAGNVAGCMVTSGVIRRTGRARLIRDGVVAWEGGIGSLRRVKDDVSEVREGFECGIGLENFNDVKVGDQIECYIVEQVAATEL
ncbi:MAG: translation initiation factor [Acidobacteriota bacterium]|jgi:translation initiation factor IF-2|nr:translation initiation factor [Acidobacteriota bacterium]